MYGINRHNSSLVLFGERLLKNSQFNEAIKYLESNVNEIGIYGKSIFFEASVKAKRWDLVIKYAIPPQTIDELTALIEAYEHTNQFDTARKVLEDYGLLLNLPENFIKELNIRLSIREQFKK